MRLVCDREEEIENFQKEEYWLIDVELRLPSGETFTAILERKGDEKIRVQSGEEAAKIKKIIKDEVFKIKSIEMKEKNLTPQPAFITSRLQQEASRILRFSPKRTMMLAQKLYEGVEIGKEGQVGLITYMRTDSVRVSMEAVNEARNYIGKTFGATYVPEKPNFFKNRKNTQDAHEAIRPTSVQMTPEKVKDYLDKDLLPFTA